MYTKNPLFYFAKSTSWESERFETRFNCFKRMFVHNMSATFSKFPKENKFSGDVLPSMTKRKNKQMVYKKTVKYYHTGYTTMFMNINS